MLNYWFKYNLITDKKASVSVFSSLKYEKKNMFLIFDGAMF